MGKPEKLQWKVSSGCGHIGLALTTNQGTKGSVATETPRGGFMDWPGCVHHQPWWVRRSWRYSDTVWGDSHLLPLHPFLRAGPSPQLHMSRQVADPRILCPCRRDGHAVQTNPIRLSLLRRDIKREKAPEVGLSQRDHVKFCQERWDP